MSVSHGLASLLLITWITLPSIAVAAVVRQPSASHQEAEPGAVEAPAALRVTVAPSIDDAALLTEWLSGRELDVSAALARPGHEQWIAVRIDGATYDYHVTVTAMRDGEPVLPSSAPLACECTTEALLSLIDDEIATAIYRLRSMSIKVFEPEPGVVGPTPERAPRPPVSTGVQLRQWTISRLGIVGAAVGAFGLVGLGAGTSLVVAEEREIEGWSKLYRELDPFGYATLSVGAAALAGGVAMLVVDGIRLRRQRGERRSATRPRRARIGLVPEVEGRVVGVVFWWRL